MTDNSACHIAVIGGGIAGSTTALHLAEQGYKVTLIEQGSGLVSGPPICHLHAGGNLYREISQQQCLDLLKQSIETVRLYPHALNVRPTVIATPITDSGNPTDLLPRLEIVKQTYQELVAHDKNNNVLGQPEEYYKLYSQEDLQQLAALTQPEHPTTIDDWLIPFAKKAQLDKLKYPVVVVQEFGLSVFRLAASVTMTLEAHPNCRLLTSSHLDEANFTHSHSPVHSKKQWNIVFTDINNSKHLLKADYLVNACGYKSGTIDDVTRQPQKRLVEFKSAFVTRWPDCDMKWPEVIFHGERGTPEGMAQLTPYPDGYFQLHGMTEDITLFKDGLSSSDDASSQPKLPLELEQKIRSGWPESIQTHRTSLAIQHLSRFVPTFSTAYEAGKPLYGAQQIPGDDPSLRAVDVSFTLNNYARVEIVKASSAYQAACKISNKICEEIGKRLISTGSCSIEEKHPRHLSLSLDEVEKTAIKLAEERGYPTALAKVLS
ncbi:FAD-dependent oxidoreductase [Vibrio sp. HN007]|uniref:FAD-dependent oxidoreductase n=1 Tax=Vibrio iocasae TaxID=3098914 RepID=UPI0035D4FAF9